MWTTSARASPTGEAEQQAESLGKEMAYVQMKSVVASLLEEFVVDVRKEVAAGGVPEHVLSVMLRMEGGRGPITI